MAEITNKKLEEHISYLHDSIEGKIEIKKSTCVVPKSIKKLIIDENYSQHSIQQASDYISNYLNIKESVRVEIVKENLLNLPAINETLSDAEKVGLYEVSMDGCYRRIKITKKANFKVDNVLAILAHENVHNFMFEYSINDNNPLENEILTDVCSVYVGLGEILIKGYKGVDIGDAIWEELGEKKIMYRWINIGYISLPSIENAMYISALYRKNIQLSSYLPLFDKIQLRWKLRKAEKKNGGNIQIQCKTCEKSYNIPKIAKGKTISITCKNCSDIFYYNY